MYNLLIFITIQYNDWEYVLNNRNIIPIFICTYINTITSFGRKLYCELYKIFIWLVAMVIKNDRLCLSEQIIKPMK